ncbi:haloacid dehalogenase-like hydrolase-domain-containing protein [Apodospora peruviana]|uniref:Haloacid dehalogenase-like hydrolase-domain-containing protein n=1 Tax=Apodospora peruviana TaxID=516989 RepID=A0AAE0MFM3_9PEZI|nr:haloacid dehalogenase-like hydrolase-domain-containing protein [Apodospora peruviana]
MTPLYVVLDFDGTITENDTIDVLGKYAAAAAGKQPPRQGDSTDTTTVSTPTATSSLLLRQWESIVESYFSDHAQHVAGYTPTQSARSCLQDELHFLESLRPVEVASADRVIESRLFGGLESVDFEKFGREAVTTTQPPVRLRAGFHAFVRKGFQKGWKMGLVSVNWSRSFVEGVLSAGGGEQEEDEKLCRRIVKRVNSIRYPDGWIEGPPELGRTAPLVTAQDKLAALRELLGSIISDEEEQQGESHGVVDQEEKIQSRLRRCVYLGDSTTDLACLVEASLGIVMADGDGVSSSKLLQTLKRLGFEVPHVSEFQEKQGLVWARNFYEVMQSRIWEECHDGKE